MSTNKQTHVLNCVKNFIYDELEYKNKIRNEINIYKEKIMQLEKKLYEVERYKDNTTEFFSPTGRTNSYRKEKVLLDIDSLKSKLKENVQRLDIINNKVGEMNEVLEYCKETNSAEVAVNGVEASNILYKLELCKKLVDIDKDRVKVELDYLILHYVSRETI